MTSRAGTWKLDLDTNVLTSSAACRANYGRGPDEPFTYQDLAGAIIDEDRPTWRALVEANLRSPEGFEVEYRVRWRDGSIHAVLVRGNIVETPPGTPPLVMGISVDITAQRLAEAQHAETRDRLKAALAGGDVGTWSWDIVADRVIADANLQRLFGVSDADASGGPIASYTSAIHPEDQAATQVEIQRAIDSRDRFEAKYRVRGADGLYRAVLARGYAEYDADGTPVRLPGVVVDISRETVVEAELQASEQRYRTLFDTIDDGFCVIQRIPSGDGAPVDYRYLEVNPAFEKQSGLTNVRGKTMREVLGPEASGWIATYDAVGTTGTSVKFERPFAMHGRHLEVSAFRVPSGDGRVAVLFKDITARKLAEDQLTANQARLSEANRAKDEFLAILGHELRNPLAPITTALELMSMRDRTVFTKEREVISRQVQHLSRLVDDLLDVSRITSGKVVLANQRISIDAVVRHAIELAAPLIEQRKHHLSVKIDTGGAAVMGDPTRLSQIVANLLTNAAKYTDAGGTIDVRVARVAEHLQLTVADNGSGIRADVLPRIFDLFVQERQTIDRGRGGLGLGLAIVKTLVALHGGTVAAHSDGPGRGSVFTVSLPVVNSGFFAVHESGDAPPTKIARRILVVDDNVDAAELLGDTLRLLGHEVQIAHDGPTALALLETYEPELAILDIGLPVMDGYELARRLRADARFVQLQLVALTGYGQASDRQKSAEAGFDLHLVKPLRLAELEPFLAA